ncbi:MAG TPA: DUF4386 domain-containing protein [Candidatus Acidoferrales bacterium]|nr:DUF4386 domain-containing protein [Candidatus Acidoferrales bacterium]
MSTTTMMDRIAGASPHSQSRMAGVIALITTTTGFASVVRGQLVVYWNASATAHNILSHDLLFRLAFVGDIIGLLYIVYALLLYNLFKPVNRSLSVLAVTFSLVGSTIQGLNCVFQFAPLIILGGSQSLSAFNTDQLQALALMFLKFYDQGYNINMVLFGTYNLLIGYLIFRSTFLPRVLGVLLAISGLCYLVNCFSGFISPAFETHLVPYILIPGAAELLLALWLVAIGVNGQRWNEQAAASGFRRTAQ